MGKITLVIFITLVYFFSGMETKQEMKRSNKLLKFEIIVPDTIMKNDSCVKIKMFIKNLTKKELHMSNPGHWGNSFPRIYHENKLVPIIKVRYSLLIINDLVKVDANDSIELNFDFSLNEILNFKFLNTGNYSINFEYYGKIKQDKNPLTDYPMKSNTITFFLKE